MFVNLTIALIALFLFSKWAFFICLAPVIRIKNKRNVLNKNVILHSVEETSQANNNHLIRVFLKVLTKIQIRAVVSGFIRYMDFQVGLIPSHHIRNFIYKYIFCVDLQSKAVIYFGSEIRSHQNLHIGEGTIIGDRSILDARRGIYIGKNVNFSSNVKIWSYQHDHSDPYFNCTEQKVGPVYIEDRAWIGPDVTILHSVTIGEGAVVAAGAVVTKDIPPFSIVAGIPAKVIGERNKNLLYEFSGNYLKLY